MQPTINLLNSNSVSVTGHPSNMEVFQVEEIKRAMVPDNDGLIELATSGLDEGIKTEFGRKSNTLKNAREMVLRGLS